MVRGGRTARSGDVRRPACLAVAALLGCVAAASAQSADPAAGTRTAVTIPSQVPLRVATTKRTRLKLGSPVIGTLTEPVYIGTQLVLPVHSEISGTITATPPVPRADRTQALLNGDVTPLRVPVVNFDTVHLPSGESLHMQTEARVRQADLIRFLPRKKQSIFAKLKGLATDRFHSEKEQVTAAHKSDRLLRFVFNQLPYHPQRVWANTQFDAELQAPLAVLTTAPEPVEPAPADTLLHLQPIVEARLTEGVSSDTAKNGDEVHAVLTQPVYDPEHRLIFPEGAALTGVVLNAKPSRRLGHNGVLRFAFRSVQPTGSLMAGTEQTLQGQVTGAEGSNAANVTVDDEGGVHANPDKDRFLGPLFLAVLAAGGHDDDGGAAQQGLGSNGLGIVMRLISVGVSSPNFAFGVGMYGFSKSLYRHFLAHGKPVAFPRDTAVEVQLSTRR